MSQSSKFEILSPVFRDGASIPPQYSCHGQNVNPPINILYSPKNTKSLTLVMHDPDAVSGDFIHWLIWDIPPTTEVISVNDVPVGAVQGANGKGQSQYTGPCPPKGTGTHHYIFDFYALDISLGLPSGSDLETILKAQQGHVLDHCTLTGLFAAED